MEDWMEYLYQQRPKPTNAKGVDVKLYTIDPNGNYVTIGNATSDITGEFSYMWTPEITGKYKVVAEFAGSKAYGPSIGQTYIGVVSAPVAKIETPIPTPTQAQPTASIIPTANPTQTPGPVIPPTSAEPTTTYLAVGAVIIIVIIAIAALILKKRK
jgi:hypothetical protein